MRTHKTLAETYRAQFNYQDSVFHYAAIINLKELLNQQNDKEMAALYNKIGDIYQQDRDKNQAIDKWEKALSIY